MEDFIAGVSNPGRADRLSIAIDGRGAFRRFKDGPPVRHYGAVSTSATHFGVPTATDKLARAVVGPKSVQPGVGR